MTGLNRARIQAIQVLTLVQDHRAKAAGAYFRSNRVLDIVGHLVFPLHLDPPLRQ
jgi:hypothetical protein